MSPLIVGGFDGVGIPGRAPSPRPAPPPPPPPPVPQRPDTTRTGPDIRGYIFGWCTWYCAQQAPWIPAGLGDALTWYERAPDHGLGTTTIPTVGAVVCYGAGGGYSSLGHVAMVRQVFAADSFEVQEMAYVAWDVVDSRHSNLTDVLGFILPPGVPFGAGLPVAPPPPPQGLDGARSTWASLVDFLEHGLPATIGQIADAVNTLRSVG